VKQRRAQLSLASIRAGGGTQPRTTFNLDWVDDYVCDMVEGATFPPITIFYDGATYRLADGFHHRPLPRPPG